MDYSKFSVSELDVVEKILSSTEESRYSILRDVRDALREKRRKAQEYRPWSNKRERLEHFKDEVLGVLGNGECYDEKTLKDLSKCLLGHGVSQYHEMALDEIFTCLKELKREFESEPGGAFSNTPIE